MNQDPTTLSLSDIAAAIAQRRITSEAVVDHCLARIEAWQPSRNCFIRIAADAARAAARERDRETAAGYSRGPLHGVPIANKDMFYVHGEECTGGSLIRRGWQATFTSTVAERLESAGAVRLGTLNMAEFAAGPTGHNAHYGHCRNAFSVEHISGGSSSGSGTAVAARLIYGSLGSDTGGSIRIPASVNGVVGLKPTYGRVSRYGALPRSWSLDHIGPIARTPRDCAILLNVIAGHDERDSTSATGPVPDFSAGLDAPIKGLRIGIADLTGLIDIDAEIGSAIEEARRVLAALGAAIVPVTLPRLDSYFSAAETIIKCESASMHRPWCVERAQDYSRQVHNRIGAGYIIPATQYIDALRLRPLMTAEFTQSVMGDIDVLLMPTLPFTAPTIAASDLDASGPEVISLVGRMTMLTRPFNLFGLPVVNTPGGFSRNGVPIGLQFIARPFQESLLLRTATALLKETRHHEAIPKLHGVMSPD
jgi:aspartyl-tRNA(Asn)/glutamyl-tRNA(Gln) amidotransferase subunit A